MPARSRSAAASSPTSRASGKARQGEHAIGLDLQQALQHAAGAAPAHAAIEQQEAGKAVLMDAEIGKRRRTTVGHLRTRQRIAGEMRRDRFNVRLSFGTRQQRHMRRYDQAAGQGVQPLRRQRLGRRLRERLAVGAGFEHGVAAELAVALPAQAECAAIGDEVARLRRRQLAAVAQAQSATCACSPSRSAGSASIARYDARCGACSVWYGRACTSSLRAIRQGWLFGTSPLKPRWISWLRSCMSPTPRIGFARNFRAGA